MTKRKKHGLKIVFALIMCFMLAGCLAVPYDQVIAAGTDVTSSLQDNKGLNDLCHTVNQYCAYIKDGYITNVKTGNIKLTTYVKYDITGYNLAYETDYNDQFDYMPRFKEKSFKQLYVNLFGEKPDIKNDNIKKASIKKHKGKIYCPVSGEWGESWPTYKIKKITETDDGTYRIKLKSSFESIDDYPGASIGTITMVVKESDKSEFGFTLKKLKYVK